MKAGDTRITKITGACERLESLLDALRARLRTQICLRAAAAGVSGVLAITILGVWLWQRSDFAPSITAAARVALLVLLAGVASFLCWRPLRRLRRHGGAELLERHLPDERGRIATYLDACRRSSTPTGSPGASAPALVELLAADAAGIAERTPAQRIVSGRRLALLAASAGVAAVGLLWLLTLAPGHWSFGSRHLLFGAQLPIGAVPVRRVLVSPGDTTVRRNSDVSIRASVQGFRPHQVRLYVRFEGEEQWERAPMRAITSRSSGDQDRRAHHDRERLGGSPAGTPGVAASGEDARSPGQDDGARAPAQVASEPQFEFKLYALRRPAQYYVEADGTNSPEHRVSVVDLPRIEQVRLTYHYPEWTGLAPSTDESLRDIRAVAGTQVQVEVVSDAMLEDPVLVVNDRNDPLTGDDRSSSGTIHVEQPGQYRIAARVAGELVALTEDYAIQLVADEKPTIEIRKPGRDRHASSIEEVPVRIAAQDDFRLREVALRYSVNGGAWKTLPMGGNVKDVEHESLLRLEELGGSGQPKDSRLAPGDLVSYYAIAKDREHSVETELYMVQVQPFERRFTQAQGGAGGAPMGEEQGAISERQREILLATWNLQRSDERAGSVHKQLRDSARMLAELQATLAQQARTLAERTRARTYVEQDERVRTFVVSLEGAAAAMDPAARSLRRFRLHEAIAPEQRALQQLLRAEAAFREVQVSMQQNGSGSEGAQASRNFTEMFELEMDLEKNQYESESPLAGQQRKQDLDEAIRKLKELAERQERLAQNTRPSVLAPEQRWRQEQLRREAEDLRRRLADMSRERAEQTEREQGQETPGGATGQGTDSRQGREAGQGRPDEARDPRGGAEVGEESRGSESQQRLARALESVDEALQSMQAAAGADPAEDAKRAGESARAAVRSLREAAERIDRNQPSQLGEALDAFARRSRQLADHQRRIESELHEAIAESAGRSGGRYDDERFGSRGSLGRARAQQLVQSKQEMAEQLSVLQGDMRGAIQEHRQRAPRATRRLGEIVRDLESSDLMYRLNRSAAEVHYGRAREAAAREGLITETLEGLQHELREAAALAAQEQEANPERATPEALLAELSALRRALTKDAQDAQPAGRRASQAGRSERARRGESGGGGKDGDGAVGASGLASWNPQSPDRSPGEPGRLSESLARETAAIGGRVREIAYRMRRGQLSQAELEALRRTASELRGLSGNPLAERTATMLQLIDQLELTALQASSRGSEAAPPRAALPASDSPRYREAVAEYYRRLGER